jgi:cephalosporin hydroxylase
MFQVNFKDCNTVDELYQASLAQLALGYVPEYPSYLPHIQEYLKDCNSYRELGTNQGCSTFSVMLSKTPYVEIVDKSFKNYNPQRKIVDEYAATNNIKIVMHECSSLEVKTSVSTDFLLVDSVHKYKHVKKEIALYEPLTKKYILFHDTVGFPDVGKAVREFLDSTNSWSLDFHLDHPNAGYTVIKRNN